MVLRSPWHLCRISLSVGREWIWGSYGSRLYFFKGCLHTHRVQGLRERRKCRCSYVDSGWGLAVINAPDTCPSQIVRSCSTGVSIMAVIAAMLSSFMWISSCGWLIDHLRFLPWLFFFFAISFPCGVSGHRPHRPLGRPWSWARCGLGSLVEKSHYRIAPKHLFKRFFFYLLTGFRVFFEECTFWFVHYDIEVPKLLFGFIGGLLLIPLSTRPSEPLLVLLWSGPLLLLDHGW